MATERVPEPLTKRIIQNAQSLGYTYCRVTDTAKRAPPVAVQRRARTEREVLGGWSRGTMRTRSYDWAGAMSGGNPEPWENDPPYDEGCTSVEERQDIISS